MTSHGTRGVEAFKSNGHNKAAQRDRTLSHGVPAQPLFHVLPVKRWIPQDIHSLLDYANGLSVASGYLAGDNPAACWASIGLGAAVIGTSLITDYRLSAIKLVPIRTHETIDYVWGASCIAMPFLLGYWKKSPVAAMAHVITGASAILVSMFTDYRSYKQQREEDRKRSQADLSPVMPT